MRDILIYLAIMFNLYTVYLIFKPRSKIVMSRQRKKSNRFKKETKKKDRRVKFKDTKMYSIKYFKTIYDIIESQNFKSEYSTDLVMLSMLTVFLLTSYLTREMGSVARIMYTLFMTHTPILLLYIRLNSNQVGSNLEAEVLVTELYTRYKMNNNMVEAIDDVIFKCKGIEMMRPSLIKLSLVIKEYGTTKDLRRELDTFDYKMGTQWSKKLTNIIYASVEDGVNQVASFESLIEDLEYGRRLYEKHKQLNSDTVLIITVIVPLLYVASLFVAVYFLDLTIKELVNNQWVDKLGMQLFLSILISQVINLTVLYKINNKKMDSIK